MTTVEFNFNYVNKVDHSGFLVSNRNDKAFYIISYGGFEAISLLLTP
ncbi:hypothetical protein KSS87_018325, partial [Heliosperma pusillum]